MIMMGVLLYLEEGNVSLEKYNFYVFLIVGLFLMLVIFSDFFLRFRKYSYENLGLGLLLNF